MSLGDDGVRASEEVTPPFGRAEFRHLCRTLHRDIVTPATEYDRGLLHTLTGDPER